MNPSRVPGPPDRIQSPPADVPPARGIGRLAGQARDRRDDHRCIHRVPLRPCRCVIGRCFVQRQPFSGCKVNAGAEKDLQRCA